MKRIQHASLLAIAGTLLVLAIALPTVTQPAGLQCEKGRERAPPLVATVYPDYLYTIGVTGEYGTDNTHFSSPRAVAVNATGHVYVVDWLNHRVQVVDNAGNYQYTIGETGVFGSDNAHFNAPNGVAVNASGYVYIADYTNQRAQVFDNAGTYQYTIGAGITFPTGVAINATGHVYITDKQMNRVQVYNNAGIFQYTLSGLSNPHGVGVNSTDHLYIADSSNHRVRVYNPTGTYLYTICGNGAGSANNQFNYPTGVAVNASGYVYVSDSNNHRVQVFDNAGMYLFTICGNGAGSNNNQLNTPYGVAVNSTGYAYVADTNNHRMQVFVNIIPPTDLTITINDGAAETGNLSVTLTLGATGAMQMCLSNNGSTYTNWEAFAPSKVWTLAGGLGLKTVYFKARNGTIEAAAPASDTITYLLPPSSMSITINDGAAETASRSVSLVVWASGAEEICFSNDGTAWSAWEPFTLAKVWGLAGGPGPKTVYFRARNSTIESNTSTSIIYTLPPKDLSIIINNGAENTPVRNVSLTLTASGAEYMCFSNDGAAWSAWEPFQTSKVWNVSSIAGYKTVYFKARNGTIESVTPVAASIIYAQESPSQDELPAWAWVIIAAVIVEGVGLLAVIWLLRGKTGTRIVPPALGGEKKSRMDILKGKIWLKGKILRQEVTGAAPGENKPEEKVIELPLKSTPKLAPKPAPAPAPEKKVEAPKPAPAAVAEKKVEALKPAPAAVAEKKVEAPKTSAKPERVILPKPEAATYDDTIKPAKKARKKAVKKSAR